MGTYRRICQNQRHAQVLLTLKALTSEGVVIIVVAHRVGGLDGKCVQVFVIPDIHRLELVET